ncbi:hypothetical protein LguiB_029201 [Lonicera macranthoides]
MPPRLANRKTKGKAKKKPVVEYTSVIDDSTGVTVSELENKDQEELAKSQADDGVAQQKDESVIMEKNEQHEEVVNGMKQEIQAPNGNCGVLFESLSGDGEIRVLASSGAEVRVKDEVVEERSTEIVMEENVNVNDKNDDSKMVGVEEKGDNAIEKRGLMVEEELIEGEVVSNGDSEPVADLNSHEENVAAEINDTEAPVDNNILLVVQEGSNQKGEGEESGDNDEESGEKDSEGDKDPIIEEKNEENENYSEIFVGGLDKKAVEDDLIEVFAKFGEIKAARIVRKSNTKKSKGFAFIQYATVEQTKNALSELKEGIEVLEKLKVYGIEEIVDIQLPDDQNTRGYILLKFSNHTNAMEAHRRLSMPDAVFGCDRSAKVAFRHTRTPNEEPFPQVKKVYIEGLAGDWDEEKLKEICKQYGEITEIKLLQGLGKKRKDVVFVTFASRESALACIEGINNAQIGQGKVKLKASIANPPKTRRLQQQQLFKGGFEIQEKNETPSKREGEKAKQIESPAKMKGNTNSKWAKRKGKAVLVEENRKSLYESKGDGQGGNKKPNKSQHGTESQTTGDTSKVENRDRKRKIRSSKGEGQWKGRKGFFQEPHAGFLPPVAGTQVHPYSGYLEPTFGSQVQHHAGIQSQPYTGYHEPAYGTQGQPHAIVYREPTVWTQGQTHSGYLEPAVVRHVQPHAGYLQPAVVRHDGQGSSGSAYVAAAAAPPPYVVNYTSYPGYEGHGGASTSGYYQSSGGGAYVPRRAYY